MFKVIFYETARSNKILLNFIKSFSAEDKRVIGGDLYAVQIGFPMGLPLCDHLEGSLWEVRSSLPRSVRFASSSFKEKTALLSCMGSSRRFERHRVRRWL